MEQNVCQLCGGVDFRRLPVRNIFKNCGYDLVQCRNCNLITVNPMSSRDTIRAFYRDEYFEKDYKCGVKGHSYYEEESSTIEKAKQVLSLVNILKPQGILLEIGCAGGIFLNQAQKDDYQVEGVEVSLSMSQKAQELYGVKVRQGDFEEVEFASESFDVICMFDVFEHLRNPKEVLKKTHRILKPEGIVVIDVPTTKNALAFRLSVNLLKVLRKIRRISLPPYHLYEYMPSTLQRFLNQTGFESKDVHKYAALPWKYLNEDGSGLTRIVLGMVRYLNYFLSVTFKVCTDRLLIIAQKGKDVVWEMEDKCKVQNERNKNEEKEHQVVNS